MIKDKSKKIKGCRKYASFAETGKQGGFGKTAILNENMGECLARRHKGTKVKPVTGEW